METKPLWDIIKGTLAGSDNEGSAKRASMFAVIMLICSMVGVLEWEYHLILKKQVVSEMDKIVISSYSEILYSLQLFAYVFGGFIGLDKVIDVFMAYFGKKDNAEK